MDRSDLDISAYLVIGPENTRDGSITECIEAVVDAGYTCIQIRSKTASARELMDMLRQTASTISDAGRSDEVALLADDRLDVVLAARRHGVKVDGIHVGQSDIPVDVCRAYLGDDSIIGLSARTNDLFEYIRTADTSQIDYFGAGPLHETETKKDCGIDQNGRVITRTFEELSELARVSPIPVVVGGGVKLKDIPELAKTGVDGFFVVSAISDADDPRAEAMKLIETWRSNSTPCKREK